MLSTSIRKGFARQLIVPIRHFCRGKHSDVVIVSALRTPIGSFRGTLSQFSAPQLATHTIKAIIADTKLQPDQVDEVILGNVCQAAVGQAPTRQAVLNAGLPLSVVTSTINKVCASGMKAIMIAAQSLALGHTNIMIAGGMESMSNVPFYLKRGQANYGHTQLIDGIVHDGLWDSFNQIHMGNCGENTAKVHGISRQQQDEYAKKSYLCSMEAGKKGLLAKEIIPIDVVDRKQTKTMKDDEEPSRFDAAKMATLKAVFQKDGTVTAANASKLNDGAAACMLMRMETATKLGLKPLAKIVDFADNAVAPIDFPIAPVDAMRKILTRQNLKNEEISMWEINEAFSVVPLANIKILNLNADHVNMNGGAVSLGHPIGMSGARIVNTLVHQLSSGQFGMASICNGGGGASALLVQKM